MKMQAFVSQDFMTSAVICIREMEEYHKARNRFREQEKLNIEIDHLNQA